MAWTAGNAAKHKSKRNGSSSWRWRREPNAATPLTRSTCAGARERERGESSDTANVSTCSHECGNFTHHTQVALIDYAQARGGRRRRQAFAIARLAHTRVAVTVLQRNRVVSAQTCTHTHIHRCITAARPTRLSSSGQLVTKRITVRRSLIMLLPMAHERSLSSLIPSTHAHTHISKLWSTTTRFSRAILLFSLTCRFQTNALQL